MNSKFIYLNSPGNLKNTPIKRLGLSRKRKSSGSDGDLNNKIQALSSSSQNVQRSEEVNEEVDDEEMHTVKCYEVSGDETIDYEKEIETITQRISEKEETLKGLRRKQNNVDELENLIEVWRNGCKSSFLYLMQILKERRCENIDRRKILKKLGIWETMLENFENDSDICSSDSSSSQ